MIAKIKGRKEIAKGTIMVDFDLQGQNVDFIPGQFFLFKLINPPFNDDKGAQRYFSIVNSPAEKNVLTIATRLSESAFKRSLDSMPIGSEVEIGNAMGKFTLPDDKSKPIVLIAGGIGITPFISMIRYASMNSANADDVNAGQKYNIILLYSNKDRASTAFYDELEKIGKDYAEIKVIFIMSADLEWKGESRRIDATLLKEYFPRPNDYIYMVAGPPPMVKAVTDSISSMGATKENILTDNFVGY